MLEFILQVVVLLLAIGLFAWINRVFNIYYFGCLPMGFAFLMCYVVIYGLFEFLAGGAVKLLIFGIKWIFILAIGAAILFVIYWILGKLNIVKPIDFDKIKQEYEEYKIEQEEKQKQKQEK